MPFEYPQVGFHFLVTFELFPPDHLPSLKDISFQSVSGLNVNVEMETYREGGENRFVHHLPTGTSYPDLVLKRGLFLDAQITGLMPWVRKAVEDFQFEPINLTVSLLNESHIPLYNWYVVGAIPKSLQIGEFNAETSSVVIETLTLDYQYFTFLKEASIAAGALGALTGSVDVSLGF